ncbi:MULTISPECIES: sigma-70 family RNA polymerase sigma factor [Aphanothece]|uniref:sigma-70 family RNA polymerase sigma factor n=1 Tax=Aphanothece TaxID=1121 RepID=UPI00398534E2
MTTSPSPSAAIEARNLRVSRYRDLVRPIALHYRQRCNEPLDDLVQVGLLGLLRAAELYRDASATPFEAFARPHIRGAVLHYLRDVAQPIRLPRRIDEQRLQLARLRRDWLTLHHRTASEAELRQALGVDQVHWCRLIAAELMLRVQSLDAPRNHADLEPPQSDQDGPADDALGSGAMTWQLENPGDGDALGDGSSTSILQLLEEPLRSVVERVVLGGWSYRRTAEALQVSPMTVQRRLHKGLGRLRELLVSSRPPTRPAASAVPGC